MRASWFKKDEPADSATAASSPDMLKPAEIASVHGKQKPLSRTRIRELLTIAVIRLMERMIAELFPCAADGSADDALNSAGSAANGPLPNFEEFLKHICRRTRTPLTCMCLALLYLTRLRANHPRSRGSPGSSYRLALSSLCVATKYLYDDAYHTCSWVQVSMGLFTQREVNQMEMEFMYFLHYQLGVTPTEWNQWIATLEAKLVSRWRAKGKAELIYSFGLFLSHECCEPSAQDTVRDIAWGEGGRNLLSLLDNAIHVSGKLDDTGKSSPSADSAVSDATCLPTPDPNSWFRIRSPELSGSQSAALSTPITIDSNPITPTTAHLLDATSGSPRCLGKQAGSAPMAPFALSTDTSRTAAAVHPEPVATDAARNTSKSCPSRVDGPTNDAKMHSALIQDQKTHHGQCTSQLGSASVASTSFEQANDTAAAMSSARARSAVSGTASLRLSHAFGSSMPSSPSHRGDYSLSALSYSQVPSSRQGNPAPPLACSVEMSSCTSARRPTAPSASSQGTLAEGAPFMATALGPHTPSGQPIHHHYFTAPRATANPAYKSRRACSNISCDRASEKRSSMLSRLTGSGFLPSRVTTPNTAPVYGSSSTIAAMPAHHGSNAHISGPNVRAASTAKHCDTSTATASSICSMSPATGPQDARHTNADTSTSTTATPGAATAPGIASMKSTGSISVTNNRRQSRRQSHRHSAASFAQKLRSFAAFNWASSGPPASSSSSNASSRRKTSLPCSPKEELGHVPYSEAGGISAYDAASAYSRYPNSKRASCGYHLSQTMFIRRHTEAQSRTDSLASVRAALQHMTSSPYEYVST
ncbi:hypothetical protein GGI12_002174 [Dipsacomyces acuminosporus]|nr:hypothetical protein GGI12_002174 [Dipsacomyces acuminosporus]